MISRSPYSVFCAGMALVALLLCNATASAQDDSRWTISLGGGVADRFTYRTLSYSFGDYPERFGFAGLAMAGAGYGLTDRVTLRTDLGYLYYHKSPYSDLSSLAAEMPFVAMGVRAYASHATSLRPRPYVEAMPTLWISDWREHYVFTQDAFGNPAPARVEDAAFTRLEPGAVVGLGFVGPVFGATKLDIGLRYLLSTGPGSHQLGRASSGDFNGLRQFSIVVSLPRPI